jgi:Zn-dependent protease with chaperone function
MTVPLTSFLHSYPGLFVTQAFFHSLVASFVSEIALRAWAVKDPAVRQRIFLVPIVAPVVLFPLFRLTNPDRGSTYFRLEAVFESERWLDVEIGGVRPVMAGLVLVFGITSLVFLFQELIPIVRNYVESRRSEIAAHARDWAEVPTVRAAMEALPVDPPRVFVVEDGGFLIFSTTGRSGAVYLSSALPETLSTEELRSAVAHEIAHVIRSRHPLLVAVYMLRALLFFNPIALMEFRRAVQEEEKVCDELAVSLTGDRGALAGALRKLYLPTEEPVPDGARKGRKTAEEIEEHSHRLNIESRISMLESGYEPDAVGKWLVPAAVVVATVAINYLVL